MASLYTIECEYCEYDVSLGYGPVMMGSELHGAYCPSCDDLVSAERRWGADPPDLYRCPDCRSDAVELLPEPAAPDPLSTGLAEFGPCRWCGGPTFVTLYGLGD